MVHNDLRKKDEEKKDSTLLLTGKMYNEEE